jgi:osmotically inducible protein OsmC
MAMVEREAHVVWEGNLAEGKGSLSEGSGVLQDAPVTFASRVERPGGQTSPEELIAAAHATCYAMALSNTLAEQDAQPERLEIDAICTLDDEQLKITTMNLDVRGRVPGINEEDFETAAREAEQLCPVSNALRGNLEIRLQTSLES